jgi:transcriptional regulator with XRE-family HTH domain
MAENVTPEQRAQGLRLKTARMEAGLDQADLAEALGVHRMTVSRWERGASPIDPGLWGQITEMLKLGYGVSHGTPVSVREEPPMSYHEAARWGYVQAARDLLNRALQESGLDAPAPPMTAAKILKELPPAAAPARRAKRG